MTVLRPADSLLYSSRSVRRKSLNAERGRAVVRGARSLYGSFGELFGLAWDAALLLALPILYLAASYLVLDLPLRWLFAGQRVSLLGVGELLGALLVSMVGLARVLQQAPPLQPVTPQFARRALVAGWLAALLLVVADLAA